MAVAQPIPIAVSLHTSRSLDISTSTSTTSTKFGSAPGGAGSPSLSSSRLEDFLATQKELWRKVKELEERDAETPLPLFGTSPRDRKLQAATTKADAQAQLDLPLPSQKPSLRSKTKFNVYATVPPFLSNEQFTAIVREISKLASLRERQAFITPYASQYYFICDQLGQLFQVLQFPTEKRGVVEILGPRLWDMETKLAEMVRRYMVWETEEERAWILGPLIEGKQR